MKYVAYLMATLAVALTLSTPSFALDVERVKHSVVLVTTYDEAGKPSRQGTAFFVSPTLLATNSHVIAKASRVTVTLYSGKTLTAIVRSSDTSRDVALLETAYVSRDWLPLAPYVSIGASVVVIGNPSGLGNWRVTVGSVERLMYFADTGNTWLVLSAQVLPGVSGAPVLDAEGRVLGIACAHLSAGRELNFAIPLSALPPVETARR